MRVVHGLAIHRDHRSSLDDAGTRVHSSRQAGIAVVGVQVFQHRPAGGFAGQSLPLGLATC